MAAGKRSLTPKVSEIVLERFLKAKGREQPAERVDDQPTPRELQIIRLQAEGKVNKEIAYQLGITVRTVEAHRAHVMQKLYLHSLADLMHYALRHGIVSAPKEPQSI